MGSQSGRGQPGRVKKAVMSKSKLCGLSFPVGRVHRLLKTSKLARASRISVSAAVYLNSVLEYLIMGLLEFTNQGEVIDLAGRVTKSHKLKTIAPRAIMLAIRQDDELLKMTSAVIFPFSGVMPSLLPSLSPKTVRKSATSPVRQPKILHNMKMPLGQVFKIVQADIADLSVDAVINPTNSTLYMGGLVGTRLMQVGGPAFAKIMQDARTEISHLQKNDAFVTKGLGTKAKNIIHVNGPVWKANQSAECITDLRETIEKCLAAADKKGFTSIALPSVGSGRAKFPKALSAETVVKTIKNYLDRNRTSLKNVDFVLFDKISIDAYTYELNRTT